jgi:hypothetical protein
MPLQSVSAVSAILRWLITGLSPADGLPSAMHHRTTHIAGFDFTIGTPGRQRLRRDIPPVV